MSTEKLDQKQANAWNSVVTDFMSLPPKKWAGHQIKMIEGQ